MRSSMRRASPAVGKTVPEQADSRVREPKGSLRVASLLSQKPVYAPHGSGWT
jgi:hypothetical protein